MEKSKLNRWADLLLDTGKRNNLINFKDTKSGTLEVIMPMFDLLFSKVDSHARLEVFDPKIFDDEDDEKGTAEAKVKKKISKADFILKYRDKIKKNTELLLFNEDESPIKVIKNISKKAKTAIEETGVNIAYMAFGFICYTEEDNKGVEYQAPVLLVPISIENESAIEPYYVKIIDNEIIVNPTFSFKLKNEYGIELPNYEDESVGEYLDKIELMLSPLKWHVSRVCKMGVFSFQKINMHKDLKDNAEKILKNKGILSLLGSDTLIENTTSNSDENIEFYNVVDADSSQEEAIKMAKEGKSFVLQGPPGTGKSQTITNIIAECLASNKKVLFVSEKLAALLVVYEKLKRAGLEEFCLELHSHKANKKDVINELCHTLKAQKSQVSDRARVEIEEKQKVEKELDKYVEELHKTYPIINKSLYSIYQEIAKYRSVSDIDFVINDIENKGEEYVKRVETALGHYAEFISSIGSDYHKNAWYGFNDLDFNFSGKAKLKGDLKGGIELFDNLLELSAELNKKFTISIKNYNSAITLKSFFNLLASNNYLVPDLLKEQNVNVVLSLLAEMKKLSADIISTRKRLDNIFEEEVYEVDAKRVVKRLKKEFSSLLTRMFSREYFSLIKEIKLNKKDNKRPRYLEALSLMESVQNYKQKLIDFAILEGKLKAKIGTSYDGLNTDFDALILEVNAIKDLFKASLDVGVLKNYTIDKFDGLKEEFSAYYEKFIKAFNGLTDSEEGVYSKFNSDEYNLRKFNLKEVSIKYQSCLENIDSVDNYVEFIKLLLTIKELGVLDYVDFSIKKKLKKEEIVGTYKKVFYLSWADVVLRKSPLLITLSRIPHDEAVKLFRKKDELTFDINKAKIKAKLSNERPNLDMIASGSAVSILLREGEKKRKQKSVRFLLEEIGELVQTLKPCFLMSPLSVSTFLSSDIKFDTVIFDEASQIFPQDAIGAIYRGSQVIVVGDSKQMPPSNFFNSSSNLEDDDEEVGDACDFESILDICTSAFPQKRLRWHYRSNFESLIAFSNKNFYESDLVTFPSSRKDEWGIGVDYIHVNGVFDRTTKTNREEAERIVDLIFEHFNNYPSRSLGVVAFSISQQNLIDRLLTKRRILNPIYEPFFSGEKKEPFFIKNLETVQGDERDTIIFSVAYGKGSDDRLILNFGPINKQGGERRLNVAFTRAKYNVKLVSSMRYTDIDLSRTSSVGVRLLKEYLDYAENGEEALERTSYSNPFAESDFEFEDEILEFLEDNGYFVDKRVGASSLKVDLAVKKKEDADYVLAIECDGRTYLSSRNARDRDRLRSQVLERMGWKYYRIWATDWFRNKPLEKDRLLKAVKNALDNSIDRKKVEKPSLKESFIEKAEKKSFEFPKYQMADMKRVLANNYQSKFNVISAIVNMEAPISEEWLLKRICFLFAREKVTSAVKEQYESVMYNSSARGIIRKNGFLYLKDGKIPMLRVPTDDILTVREIKDIEPTELANGMLEVIKQNLTVEKGSLYHLLAEKLGFGHVGKAMAEAFDKALYTLKDKIDIEGETLSIK